MPYLHVLSNNSQQDTQISFFEVTELKFMTWSFKSA